MTRRWTKFLFGWAVALLLVAFAPLAFASFTPPPMQDAVTDTAGKLTAGDDHALEERVTRYRNRTGNEIAVLVTGSLGGESIEDVAYRTFNTWKLGKEGKDNGVLLVLAPTERRTRIETGKGIGDRLTDLDCAQILRERVGPLLKEDRFREAIDAALDAIEAALDGRPPPNLPPSLLKTALVPGAYVVDRAHALDPAVVTAIETDAAKEGRWWKGFAIVVTDDVTDTRPEAIGLEEIKAKRATIPLFRDTMQPSIVLIGAKDRKVVAVTPGYAGQAEELSKLAATIPTLDAAIRVVAGRYVEVAKREDAKFRAAQREADEQEARKPKGWHIALLVLGALALPTGILILLFYLSHRFGSKSDGGSYASSSTDSGTDASDWSSGSSSSSSSVDTSYSGGGGHSGGGGASDSY